MNKKILHKLGCKIAGLGIIVMFASLVLACPDDNSGTEQKKPDTKPTVTGVTVAGGAAQVKQGANSPAFTASVQGTNSPGQGVTWTIETEAGAAIPATTATFDSATKILSVKEAATLNTKIVVKATSTVDTTKSGKMTVTVTAKDSGGNEKCCDGNCSGDCNCPSECDCGCQNVGVAVITGIEVDATDASVKKAYLVNEMLDTTGVKVFAVYDDETETELLLSDVTFTPAQLTTAGENVTITASYTAEGIATPFTDTYTVSVSKRTLTVDSFSIAADSFEHLTGQNIRNTITPIAVEYTGTNQVGAIKVLYNGVETLPNKAGTFAITIDVAANDVYNAAAGLDMNADLEIDKVELSSDDFVYTEFADQQVLKDDAPATTLVVTWAESKIWNNNGAAPITVLYVDDEEDETNTIPAVVGWYTVFLSVPELEDYYNEDKLPLFTFQVVEVLIPMGTADITINHWVFDDKAPEIEGGVVSKTGIGGVAKTKVITITGVFTEVEWYLNSTKTSETGNSYTFDSAGLALGGPHFVTVRVKIGDDWFSRTVRFTVNP